MNFRGRSRNYIRGLDFQIAAFYEKPPNRLKNA
jgi:hypothetical protein